MTQLWMDGFDHYGGSTANMLAGAWAEIDGVTLSNTRARTGVYSLRAQDNSEARRVFGVSLDTVFVSTGLFLEELPNTSGRCAPLQFRTGGNVNVLSMTVRTDGVLEARIGDADQAVAGATTGPVIVARTWHHIECKIVRHASAGTFEIRVDEAVVLSLTGLALGASSLTQLATRYSSIGGFIGTYYLDDLIVRDSAGAYNNTFQGDLRVATLQPIANSANQGWATRSIQKLGVGVAEFLSTSANRSIAYADNAAFEIGSGDFCAESFVRWRNTSTGTDVEQIIGKYRVDNNTRSWRLFKKGPDDGSMLTFATCTDGTLGDVVDVIEYPLVPILKRWYHIAVSRQSGVLRMFIDGVQVGVDTADARTYQDNASSLMINGQQGAGASLALSNAGVDGWMDGTRLTVGAARYTANFTPPSVPLTDDANTALLLNYDSASNPDESTNAFVGTLVNSAAVIFPADALAYQTIDGLTPDDNDFIEAALVAAVGTLTFTANPLNTETITLGTTTYTFQTVLVDTANNVLIGADADASLNNLRAAINLEAGVSTLYGNGTVANVEASASDLPGDQLLATAKAPGTGANTDPTTSTVTGGTWSAATLLGGLDIPGISEFDLSVLPPDVTGVRAVALVGRNFKIDAGSSEMQMSLKTLAGGVSNGAARPMTLTPTYYEDTIEQDPNTAGALTPTTILGSLIRVDRTA